MTDNIQTATEPAAPEPTPQASIDELIEQLPDQFPAAVDMIKDSITPHLIDCNPGVRDRLYRNHQEADPCGIH